MRTLLSAESLVLCFGQMEMVHIGKTSSGQDIRVEDALYYGTAPGPGFQGHQCMGVFTSRKVGEKLM
jgi:hypothetical protein